jgi:mannose-6-phosphate isomerase
MNGISKASASIICNMTHTTPLYPLLFENNFHTIVWGGNSLKPLKGLPKDNDTIGESWEVSAVPSSKSVVKNGPLAGHDLEELTAEYGELLLGKAVMEKYGKKFPILIKFIDAAKDLSIQVHPDDALAKERHNCFGKTEMWYVMKAEPGACLYSGLNQHISKYEYGKRIEDGSICDVLQKHEVKAGDVFFIPAGRIHAICGGLMVAEIQQSSDITYRIFDYNRMGLDGKPRQLHTEEAVDAIDYTVYDDYRTSYERKINKPVPLVVTPFFVVKLLEVDRSFHRKLYKYDSFIAYMCLQGDCTIRIKSTQGFGNGVMPAEEDTIVRLTEGNSCLITASVADLYIAPNNSAGVTKLLETYIYNKNY